MSYPGLNHVTVKYGQILDISVIIYVFGNIYVSKYS